VRSLEQLDRSNRRSNVLLMHKAIWAPRTRGAEATSCSPRPKDLLTLLWKEPLEPVVAASLSLSSILHRRRPRRGTLGEGFGAAGAAKFVWRLLGVGLIIVSSVLLSRATAAVGKTCGALGKQQVQSWALAAAAMKPECLWPRRPPLAPPPQPQAERWLLLESHSHSRRSGRYKIRPLRQSTCGPLHDQPATVVDDQATPRTSRYRSKRLGCYSYRPLKRSGSGVPKDHSQAPRLSRCFFKRRANNAKKLVLAPSVP
jgi:hypothetical protein